MDGKNLGGAAGLQPIAEEVKEAERTGFADLAVRAPFRCGGRRAETATPYLEDFWMDIGLLVVIEVQGFANST
jgi:hypothetical protein